MCSVKYKGNDIYVGKALALNTVSDTKKMCKFCTLALESYLIFFSLIYKVRYRFALPCMQSIPISSAIINGIAYYMIFRMLK